VSHIGVILRSRPDYWPAGQQYDTRGIKHTGPQQLPQFIDALADSGFDDMDIRGFLDGIFRRVAAAAWQGSIVCAVCGLQSICFLPQQ
jgi:membrane dipeptidase